MTYTEKLFSVLEKISGYPLANSDLSNSTITVAGHSISLGGSHGVAFTDLSDTGTGEVANADLANDSVTVAGNSVALGATTGIAFTDLSDKGTGEVANSDLANTSITVNGTSVSLGGSGTIPTATPNVVSKTAAYTASNDDYVLGDASGGAFTVTLPAPTVDDYVVVKKTDSSANAVTVSQNGTETIDGAATKDLSSQYDSISVTSDGTNWYIV